MREKIDYSCEECGHIGIKKKNWKTRTLRTIRFLFLSIFILMATIGSMGIYNFVVSGIYDNPDVAISLGQALAFGMNLQVNFQSNIKQEN